jgi:hypothetical protein
VIFKLCSSQEIFGTNEFLFFIKRMKYKIIRYRKRRTEKAITKIIKESPLSSFTKFNAA